MTGAPPVPRLYFLIEETSRELASRVLLCTIAAERGLSSAIIPQWAIWEQFDRLPPGIVIFKGSNTLQTRHMFAAHKAGHLVAAIEEEALGLSLDTQIQRLFDPRIIQACDLILAQGNHLRDVIVSKDPALADRVIVTGNPRIDLLRPPFSAKIMAQAREVQRVHGDYVLINSNIGSVNPRVEDTYFDFIACLQVGLIRANNTGDRADFMAWCGWERDNLDLLARLIGTYLERPDYPKLIIRPHPSENVAKWREAYRDETGVSIIQEGDHLPWTAGARLLIHTGCTTGTEAVLLGTPALSLQGGTSRWHNVSTSNHVNPTANTVDQAISMLSCQLSGETDLGLLSPEKWAELERYVLPWPNDLAANRVIQALCDLTTRRELPEGRFAEIQSLRDCDYQVAEEKISSDSFTPDTVENLARGFATDLGYHRWPVVQTIGTTMIIISPGW